MFSMCGTTVASTPNRSSMGPIMPASQASSTRCTGAPNMLNMGFA